MSVGLSVKEKNIFKLALTLTLAFSPPKSLSDAGGGLCGLNVKYFFNYQSQIKGCEDTVTVFRLWSLVFGMFVIPVSIIEPKTNRQRPKTFLSILSEFSLRASGKEED